VSQLAIAPFKRMVRKIDPRMKISDNAKMEVRRMSERFAMDVLRGAVQIAKVAKRKTVKKEDIIVAKKQLVKTI
jgi:histone H3/H4